MITIASLIDPQADHATRSWWAKLEQECQLSEIKTTPHPHISWQSADQYDLNSVRKIINERVKQQESFALIPCGLGIFTGEAPIIYIAVVKTESLLMTHKDLWMHLNPFARQLNPNYNPENWMPHITIARGDVNPENLNCAMRNLIFQDFSMPIRINNFAILTKMENIANIDTIYPFSD